mmetsp:Transcript_69/g.135  ORF Transcript_69/g.135 Transcript_69/m.135 type:complete len:281 (+) Transcript_69:146-988(+)|eukprot:scaffold7349_cov173-Amphora_coffeaeformis.AAC.82
MSPSDEGALAAEHAILPRRTVTYCGACGMPLEYCEYGPDFESHCVPWWKKNHTEMFQEYVERTGKVTGGGGGGVAASTAAAANKKPKPDKPWTTEQRLMAFYEKYVPEKVESVPALLEKYAGKEDNLFNALVKKYGPEPNDPYFTDSEDEEEEEDEEEGEDAADDIAGASKKNRRGAHAKKTNKVATRVVVQKVAQKKKRNLTIISGMETIPGIKLKDVSKAFSKKFAGSSSVKKNAKGEEEIIIQGDHVYDVAEMIVDKFGAPESAVFLDIDGSIHPLR